MQPLRLHWDVNNDHRTTELWPLDMRASTQSGGTLRNRVWGEGDRHSPRGDVVGDAEVEMVILTAQRHRRLGAARVTPHVTESFRHHLKHLGRQTIMHRQRRLGLHVYDDTSRLRKFFGKALHCWQQAAWEQSTVTRPVLSEFPRIVAEI